MLPTMQSLEHRLKEATSLSLRRNLKLGLVRLRLPTAGVRHLPDFLIIGTQRGGTDSLFKSLGQHPWIVPSLRKEVEYFTRQYARGLSWYRCHWPTLARKAYLARVHGSQLMAFEATPDYMFYPGAAARAARTVPHAKIIVLLRNPVDRAISHYRHMVRLGFEGLPIEEALACEGERISSDITALRQDPLHYCRNLLRFSYVLRGRYAEQIEQWMEHYSEDRFLIIRSQDLFASPGPVYQEILSFLGLPAWHVSDFPKLGYYAEKGTSRLSSDSELRRRLGTTFAPENERLSTLLKRDVGWTLEP